jgi:hypothetical protein
MSNFTNKNERAILNEEESVLALKDPNEYYKEEIF